MGTFIRHTRLEAEPNGSRFVFKDLIEVVEEAKRQSVPERADVSLISGGPMSKPQIRISWEGEENGA